MFISLGRGIGKLNAAIVDALADPVARTQLADVGHVKRWWPIIKAANIKVE